MGKKAKITVHPLYTIGEISPRIFSTFLEPIGTMVNGTMYNPKHKTADEQGFRKDVIDALKNTPMPAIRLPGGNFVSAWDWKDSIGPVEKRKVHLDPAWYQVYENKVGHDEYLQWAEKVDAEPMYTINLGTGSIKDAMDIVEYTNHEGGTYWSDLRKENGHEKPYKVKTWYLGNEMDGPWQIGSWEKNPKGYGITCNEVSKVMKWIDPSIETAVCASSAPFMDHYPTWEEEVLTECYETVDYISMHHYHIAAPGDYKALLGGSVYFEDFINTEIAMCDLVAAKLRSPKKMMLSFDEYGCMEIPFSPLHPGYGPHNMAAAHYKFDATRKYILHDPDNMTEREFPGKEMIHALSMASVQLAFIRHADRVKIGCMTGGLGALCASNHDHVWKSASHYPFMMLMEHAKGMSMKTIVECETFDLPGYAINDTSEYTGKENVPYIDAASAWDKENDTLAIFVINRNDTDTYPLSIDISAFKDYVNCEHYELATSNLDDKNTFENPDTLVPVKNLNVKIINQELEAEIKPLSFNMFIISRV